MKKLLFTGASGFLGKNIISDLYKKYEIKTLGITEFDDYKINLAEEIPSFNDNYDYVIHASGKAHVIPKNKKENEDFFNINLIGTKNLCEGLEQSDLPSSFIFISTVAVYGPEYGENITEDYPLKGSTPYAKSKIDAEYYLKDWCKENNIKLCILRPALIAGKKPPGNLGALIKGIKTNKYFRIGDGNTRKSVLMVQDIANLIPKLTETEGIFNLCDNHHPTFAELEELIVNQLNIKSPKTIPFWLAKSIARIGDLLGTNAPLNSAKLDKITKPLTFSNEKAKNELDWEPLDVLQNFKIL